jgi:tRNA A-37 threonylcarbamoyl transferase component Bud32
VARFLTRVPLLLSKHLWVWPLLGAVVLVAVGYWVRDRVETATRSELASRLTTLLYADIAALRLWFSQQESDARSLAADVRIEAAIVELAEIAKITNVSQELLTNSAAAKTLQQHLRPVIEAQRYLDYVVIGADKRILASTHPRVVTRTAPRGYDSFVDRALRGHSSVSRPFAREATLSQRAEGPTMFVVAPVNPAGGKAVAVLALRMRPEEQFSQIFSVARMGDSGEAYAFDRRGIMLTASRFEDELKRLGLVPKEPEATAILNLRLLDPEVNMERGEQPKKARRDMHLTKMAAAAVLGDDGVDVVGYRNYRGVKVVGAWAWLPEYGIGIATEVSTEEAFQTLYMLRQAFMVLFLLLALSGLAIFGFTLLVERLEASIRKSALGARRLGQYVLVQEIGRGNNGMVYRARHALMRRPVAVKLLSPDMTNEANARRFEHEVQMTSQLTHPNTVAIYDYGRTPEGLFYYAMEYLSGIDLNQLTRQFGPQPEGRVIHILRQVCGSLAEAHRIGLIHRDIKPANIVLTHRGGLPDLVKVLDFGLVKAVHQRSTDQAAAQAVVGTPHFMSPEAVDHPETVGARSDVYSVGAVGYWLLSGKTLFDSDDVDQLLRWQVDTMPMSPSDRLGKPVSADLEELLMSCLAKSPDVRPASAEALETALGRCAAAGAWTVAEGAAWWKSNMAGLEMAPAATMAEKTLVIAPRG